MKYQRWITSALGLVAAMMSQPIQAIDFLALEGGTGEESAERIGAAVGWLWARRWSLPAGLYLSGHWELSLSYWDGEEGRTGNTALADRFQHLSNSGSGDSNPGINFHLVRLLYYF